MNVDQKAAAFVETLDQYSGKQIDNKNDLAILLSLSAGNDLGPLLERIAFLAKFSVKSRKIMNRIGHGADGYDALAAELNRSLAEITDLLKKITMEAPMETRLRISERYLALSASGMQNLFSLLTDLSWYKNWLIDHPAGNSYPS